MLPQLNDGGGRSRRTRRALPVTLVLCLVSPVTRGARSHLGVLLLTVTLLWTGASHQPGRRTPQLLPISMVVTCHTWQMMDRQHAKAMNGPLRSTSVLISEQFCLAIMGLKH